MKSCIILSLVISLLLTGSLSAATKFLQAVDELWSNPDNWNKGIPSLEGDDTAKVPKGVFCVVDYAAPVFAQLNIRGGDSHLRLVDGAHLVTEDWGCVGFNGSDAESRELMEILGGCMIAIPILGPQKREPAFW